MPFLPGVHLLKSQPDPSSDHMNDPVNGGGFIALIDALSERILSKVATPFYDVLFCLVNAAPQTLRGIRVMQM